MRPAFPRALASFAPGLLLGLSLLSRTPSAQAQPAPLPPAQPVPLPPATGAPVGDPRATAPTAPATTAAPGAPTPAGTSPAPLPTDPATARDASKPAPRPQTSEGVQGALSQRNSEVFSEEWWSHTRPVLEMHGYYRLRAELFQNFFLGRIDGNPNATLFAPPVDYAYTVPTTGNTVIGPAACPTSTEADCRKSKTQAGANMRLRLNPEIHVSDNLRVLTQLDLLDNLVLGSTPNTYYVQSNGQVGPQSPYAPRSFFANTTEPPTAGRNNLANSIAVKRAWGEYSTPLGMVRFGRQPNHWGMGMLHNSGDGHDSDWQSSIDRILFMTGIKSLDLYFAGMWDFPSEGTTRYQAYELQGQPYDAGQLDDVSQYGLMVMRRRNPDLVRQDLAAGNVVINGGLYTLLRRQTFANDASSSESNSLATNTPGASVADQQRGLVRRNAWSIVPDAWLQVRYRKFRFELEAATVQGSIDSLATEPTSGTSTNQNVKLRQYLLATQSEFRAIEDKLRVQFNFGWASGDPDLTGADALAPKAGGLPNQGGNRTLSMGSFHPDFRVDLILFRNIMTRVQGAYYFKPQVEYDFIRNLNGQKVGGGAGIIWSRASQFVQAPGHKRDLGVELDFQLYYQSKDGSLNDDPDRMGGFFTSLQYGVLFPLGGLGYQDNEVSNAQAQGKGTLETSAAHIMRWYMGILF